MKNLLSKNNQTFESNSEFRRVKLFVKNVLSSRKNTNAKLNSFENRIQNMKKKTQTYVKILKFFLIQTHDRFKKLIEEIDCFYDDSNIFEFLNIFRKTFLQYDETVVTVLDRLNHPPDG